MLKLRHIFLLIFCLLLTTTLGCNVDRDQENVSMDTDNYRAYEADQAIDSYSLNEREQLNGFGQKESNLNTNGTISNANTDIASEQYPHTKAIQIQQAKYKFVFQGGGKNAGDAAGQEQGKAAPAPGQKQTPDSIKEAAPQAPAKQPNVAAPQPRQQQEQPKEQQQQQPKETQKQAPAAEGISEAAARVIELTNAERRKNGLSDYQADAKLSNVATVKSDDMQQNNYFSHTSPTHGSPFDMIRDHGVSYNAAGENIAQGQSTPEQVVQSWMNSEGHRKNIMSDNFTHIGVGYNENGHYWTQMFISK